MLTRTFAPQTLNERPAGDSRGLSPTEASRPSTVRMSPDLQRVMNEKKENNAVWNHDPWILPESRGKSNIFPSPSNSLPWFCPSDAARLSVKSQSSLFSGPRSNNQYPKVMCSSMMMIMVMMRRPDAVMLFSARYPVRQSLQTSKSPRVENQDQTPSPQNA
jgi:hypothetical protein